MLLQLLIKKSAMILLHQRIAFSLVDPRPVCKLKFVHCGLFRRGGLYKFKRTFSQLSKLRFLTIFPDFFQKWWCWWWWWVLRGKDKKMQLTTDSLPSPHSYLWQHDRLRFGRDVVLGVQAPLEITKLIHFFTCSKSFRELNNAIKKEFFG